MSTQTCDNLIEWFKAHNGKIDPALSLRKDDRNGYHFRTSIRDLPASPDQNGTPVCRCPLNLTLSYLNVKIPAPPGIRDCSNESIVSKIIDRISPQTAGYIFLIEQRLKGKQSFWWPYIDALPKEKELSTPLWFEEADLKWLLGTNMYSSTDDQSKSAIEQRRQMWKGEWENSIDALKAAGADVDGFTWELFLWATTMFSSRSFASKIMTPGMTEEFSLLYPVIDIFNHCFGAKVVWNLDKGDFILAITESARKGDQIFNNYAPKGNEELLMGYGFSQENNPCDEFTIRIGQPPKEVFRALREALPVQFSSPEWTAESSTFYLRGSKHYSGGFQHDPSCLRGIQPELFHTICAILSYSNGEMNDDDIVDAAVSAILDRLRDKSAAILKWNLVLPMEPQNMRQAYAKIYRDGQITILEEIIGELEQYFM